MNTTRFFLAGLVLVGCAAPSTTSSPPATEAVATAEPTATAAPTATTVNPDRQACDDWVWLDKNARPAGMSLVTYVTKGKELAAKVQNPRLAALIDGSAGAVYRNDRATYESNRPTIEELCR